MSDHVPAFPLYGVTSVVQEGMLLRDYFAAKAMQGELAASSTCPVSLVPDVLAKYAYQIADAMLVERAK